MKRSLKIPRDNVSQSVKQLGRKTFEPEETLFTRGDMPDTVRRIKEDIDRSKDPDILERHKARWNSSVDATKQFDKDLNSMRAAMHKVRSIFMGNTEINSFLRNRSEQGNINFQHSLSKSDLLILLI